MSVYRTEYVISIAHWNTGFNAKKTKRKDYWRAIHGHNMRVMVEVKGEPPLGSFLYDELVIREEVLRFDNTFLPEHPKLKVYGASQEGFSAYLINTLSGLAPAWVTFLAVEVDEAPGNRYRREWDVRA